MDSSSSNEKSEVYWQSLSNEWKQSGLSQPEFCKQKNIRYSQFTTWRTKFLKKAGLSRSQLKPVRLKSASPQSSIGLQINFPNGVILQIPVGVDQATLITVLRSLGGASC